MLCILFLAFNLEVVPGRPWHGHYALIWKWNEYVLVRILPQNVFVLVDENVLYRYTGASKDTYVSAIRLDTYTKKKILNYRYLLEWIQEPPIAKSYPSKLSNEIEILNYLTKTLN